MPALTRRNLMKASAALAAYGVGLGGASLASRSAQAANRVQLEAVRANALLDGQHLTHDVMTYSSGAG